MTELEWFLASSNIFGIGSALFMPMNRNTFTQKTSAIIAAYSKATDDL